MRKYLALALLTPLLALPSCSGSTEKQIVDRSGDLLVSTASTYATIGNQRTYKQMLSSLEQGETVLFFFASYSCTHCHDFESIYIKYMRQYAPYMYVYYMSDGSDESIASWYEVIDGIGSYYGIERRNDNPFRYTPTLWLANKDGYSSIEIAHAQTGFSEEYLENSIKSRVDYSNLYYFSSYENFSQVNTSSTLAILYSQEESGEYFHENLYSLAHNSAKTTYVLDYDTMSEEHKTLALSYFGLSEYSFSFSLGGRTMKEEDALSYYGASSSNE